MHEFVFTPSEEETKAPFCACLPKCCTTGEQNKRSNVWNLDGELYRKPGIRVINHSGLIRIISCL